MFGRLGSPTLGKVILHDRLSVVSPNFSLPSIPSFPISLNGGGASNAHSTAGCISDHLRWCPDLMLPHFCFSPFSSYFLMSPGTFNDISLTTPIPLFTTPPMVGGEETLAPFVRKDLISTRSMERLGTSKERVKLSSGAWAHGTPSVVVH